MNGKYLVLAVIAVLVITGAVGAKEIVVSNGISLADTAENRTVVLKEVVTDMKAAPVALATKTVAKDEKTLVVVDEEKVYSASPVTDALLNMPIESKAGYKAEYIARYADIVGEHTVTIDSNMVSITIYSSQYDEQNRMLKMNLTATVNGVEKQIHNPYRINNPPALVPISQTVVENGIVIHEAEYIESPDNAVLQSLAQNVINLPDGNATFDGSDPILVVYATDVNFGTPSTVANSSTTTSYLEAIRSNGNGAINGATVFIAVGNTSSKFSNYRVPLIYDTSFLDTSMTVLNASSNLYVTGKSDPASLTPSMVISDFYPTSRTAFTVSEYQRNGTARMTGDIVYASVATSAYNTQYYTAYGISKINFTSYTDTMARTDNDADSINVAVPPTGTDGFFASGANATGTSQDPYISITYAYVGYDTESDFYVDTRFQVNGTAITFVPYSGVAPGNYFNWSLGDGTWTNSSTNDDVEHTYGYTNIFTPALYIYNTTSGQIVNQTIKSEYIGIDSGKFYPMVDGYVARTTTGTFTAIRNGAGTAADTTAATAYARLSSAATTNNYNVLNRRIEIYNMADFASGSFTIVNASLNEFGNAHASTFSTNPNLVVTNVSPASLTGIVAADYNKFGNVIITGNKTYAAYSDSAYNRLYFTPTGISSMNQSGITPYMLRTSWDTDNSSPTWSGSKTAYFLPNTTEASLNYPFMFINFTAATADFTANTTVGIIGASTIQFYDTTNPFQASWNWSFGDGTYSAAQNGTHTYTTQGLFNVSFTTPYPGGATKTMTNYINISSPSFVCSPTFGDVPLTISCNDTSAVITGDNQWVWGDTTVTDDGPNVTHTYTSVGAYTIQMQTPSATGDVVTMTDYISAGVIVPIASITSNQTTVATGSFVQFNDTSAGTPTSWNWSFDNTTIISYSSVQNPLHRVLAPSHISGDIGPWTETVRLNSSNSAGYDISDNYTITIMDTGWYPGLQAPTASFTSNATFSKTNVGKQIGFTDTSSNSPTYWEWTVRNATDNSVLATSTTQNPTIQFTQIGNFSVNLTVKNSIGGSTRIEYMQVFGLGLPYADFYGQPTSGTPGMLVSFVDQSLKGTSTGLTCNWSFGDSTYSPTPYSSTCGNVQHVYGYAGVYDVSFNVTNANGTSTQTKLQYITVSVDQNTHNTWYSPHAVQFRVWDSKSNPVVGTFINATADSSTFPPGSDWLVEMYGLNIDVANQMMNGTLAMNGTTDSSGAITFTMHPSVRYTIRVINPSNGLAHTTNVSPIDSTYTIRLTGSAANNTYMDMGYNTSLYVTEPDVHNVTMNLRYQDMSGRTSLLEFFVMARPNNTVIDYQTLSGFGTGTVLMNYTVPNVRAHQYSWYYNAIRTV